MFSVLAQLDPRVSAELLKKMADFYLLVDSGGCILEVAVHNDELGPIAEADWVGRDWADTVSNESRNRIGEMLEQAHAHPGVPVVRDVAHPLADGSELLIQYRTVSRGEDEPAIAVGQDMRPMVNLRQQLMNAQQALEQDYWRLRQIETRYRRLFDMVSEAMVVVDGDTERVIEANPQAARLLTADAEGIAGKTFPLGLDKPGTRAVTGLLQEVRSSGRGTLKEVHSEDGTHCFDIDASYLRQGDETRYLLRIGEHGAARAGGAQPGLEQSLQAALQHAPDAILVTDEEGRVLAANKTFLDLAQVLSEEQVIGQLADRWLGRSGVDLSVLLTNLRRNQLVKLFSSTLQGDAGSTAEVEISATGTDSGAGQNFCFFIRDVGRRVAADHPAAAQLPRSIEQITKRVGRVPLKELVRESTDVIEALCIEEALTLTHDNRASAAELLGLSRQSLYAKLRRYGIGGADEGD
jgi:transcriptional regulator PpsR